MGVVYAGLDDRDRRVAVKCVHRSHAADGEFRARFAREVNLVRRVRAAGVPAFRGADTRAEVPWLATEYVPGPTLDHHLREHGPLAEDALDAFSVGVAETLAAVHAQGVVHRDLKPGNVILSPDGPKVLDFGIARAAEESTLTRTGGLVGTPGWISPEQYREQGATDRSDVFAWAALVAYAATGTGPFGSGTSEVLASRVLSEPPSLADVPEHLHDVLERALAKDPGNRPTAAEILAETEPAAATVNLSRTTPAPVPTGPDDPWRRHASPRRSWARRHGRILSAGAAGLALALAAGAVVWALPLERLGIGPGAAVDGAVAGGDTAEDVLDGDTVDDSVPEEYRDLFENGNVTVVPDPEVGDTLVRSLEPAEPDGTALEQVRLHMGEHSWSDTMDLTVTVTAEYLLDFGELRLHSSDFLRVLRIDPEDERLNTWPAGSGGTLAVLSPEEPTAQFELSFLVLDTSGYSFDTGTAVFYMPPQVVPEVGSPGGLYYLWRGSQLESTDTVPPEPEEVTPHDSTLVQGSPVNSCVHGPTQDTDRGLRP